MKNFKAKVLLVAALAMLAGSLMPAPALAQEAIDPNFDPGLLIPDEAFIDTGTFGSAAGVQQFLEVKGSVLARTDAAFIAMLKEPSDIALKTRLEDRQPSLGRKRTAAELIYDAALSAGLNAQVLLVTLQKEQSLITGKYTDANVGRVLDKALGYGCPDNQPCQANLSTFYNQLFGTVDAVGDRWLGAAKSLAKSYTENRGPLMDAANNVYGSGPFVRMARKGDTVTFQNTLGGYAGVLPYQTVTIKNASTAALYRFTPHVFNGNYNFWRFYRMWFKYPNGTVLKLSSDPTLWIVENGLRKSFTPFVAAQRKINTAMPIVVSQTELSSYDDGGRYMPFEGTLMRAEGDLAVYVVVGNEKRPLTIEVFKQRNYSFANVAVLPRFELDALTTGALMPPMEGSLIKGPNSLAVYQVEGQTKRPFSYNVFMQRGLSFKNVVVMGQANMDSLTDGLPVTPLDGTLIRLEGQAAIYMYSNGLKAHVPYSVYMGEKLYARPHISLSQHEMDSIPTASAPLMPKNGTLLRSSDDLTVYLVQDGTLHALTYEAFMVRGLKFSAVIVTNPEEVAAYPKGEPFMN